jgi:hypothetical protein
MAVVAAAARVAATFPIAVANRPEAAAAGWTPVVESNRPAVAATLVAASNPAPVVAAEAVP